MKTKPLAIAIAARLSHLANGGSDLILLRILYPAITLSRRMHLPPCVRALVVSLFILGSILPIAHGKDVDKDAVLAEMRSLDTLYRSGVTLKGEITSPPPFNARHLPETTNRWTFTRKGDLVGYIEEPATEVPRYIMPPDNQHHKKANGVSYDSDLNMHVSLGVGRVVSFGNKRTSLRVDTKVYTVSPANELVAEADSHSFIFAPPDSNMLSIPIDVVQLSSGRGYSRLIDSVVEVHRTEDGALEVVADGSFGDYKSGEWRIRTYPERRYIVMSASFVSHRGAEPLVSVSMSGTTVGEGCVSPASGTCVIAGVVYHLSIDHISLSGDDSVLESASRLANDTHKDRTSIMDYTVSPPRSDYWDIAPVARSGQLDKKEDQRTRWVVSVNLAILIIVIAVFAIYWVKKRRAR